MRLMGKSKLSELARNPSLRGAVACLWQELEEYSWRDAREAARDYPAARLDGHRMTIDIVDGYCAIVAINFALGIALVEFAGRKADRRRRAADRASRKST
jgi:hypothetical protein